MEINGRKEEEKKEKHMESDEIKNNDEMVII